MKTKIFIITLFIFFGCSKKRKGDFVVMNDSDYKLNPVKSDSTCITDLNKAKLDVKRGKLVFYSQYFGKRYKKRRSIETLKKLCKNNGLEFKVELMKCIAKEGQTDGCYINFMNKTVANKFGENFKSEMYQKADSLFTEKVINENLTLFSFFCDKEPKPILENKKYIESTLDINHLDLKKTSQGGIWPSMDLSFIVEKDGTISKFYCDNYISNIDDNLKFKDDLYKIAVQEMKTKYSNWVPGSLNNKNVRTDANIRFTFIGN